MEGGRPHSAQREPIPALSLADCSSHVSPANTFALLPGVSGLALQSRIHHELILRSHPNGGVSE